MRDEDRLTMRAPSANAYSKAYEAMAAAEREAEAERRAEVDHTPKCAVCGRPTVGWGLSKPATQSNGCAPIGHTACYPGAIQLTLLGLK